MSFHEFWSVLVSFGQFWSVFSSLEIRYNLFTTNCNAFRISVDFNVARTEVDEIFSDVHKNVRLVTR